MESAKSSSSVKRFSDELDFVYLNPNLVLMKAPDSEKDAVNHSNYFRARHPGKHHLIDCTSAEYAYEFKDIEMNYLGHKYYDSVARYESEWIFTMKQLFHLMRQCEEWLSRTSNTVIVIVDEDGLGKSAAIAACLALHMGLASSTETAVKLINEKRTPDASMDERAISLPSHRRCIRYYEALLTNEEKRFQTRTYQLCGIRISGSIPNLQKSLTRTGINPHMEVFSFVHETKLSNMGGQSSRGMQSHRVISKKDHTSTAGLRRSYTMELFNQLQSQYHDDATIVPFYRAADHPVIDLDVSAFNVFVRGETAVDLFSEDYKWASVTFHTAFIDNCYLELDKASIDLLSDDVFHHICGPEIRISLMFAPTIDRPAINDIEIGSGAVNYDVYADKIAEFFSQASAARISNVSVGERKEDEAKEVDASNNDEPDAKAESVAQEGAEAEAEEDQDVDELVEEEDKKEKEKK